MSDGPGKNIDVLKQQVKDAKVAISADIEQGKVFWKTGEKLRALHSWTWGPVGEVFQHMWRWVMYGTVIHVTIEAYQRFNAAFG